MRTILLGFLAVLSLAAAPAGNEPLDLQDIVFLVESNTPEQELIDTIKKQRIRFRLDENAEKQLQRKGVSDRVIAVLRHVQLIDDVIAMKLAGKDEIEIIRMVADRGTVLVLEATDKLLLHKKGVTADVINALMGNFTFRDFRSHEHPGGFFRVQHPEGWKRLEEFEDDRTVVAFTPQDRTSSKLVHVGFRIEFAVAGSRSPHAKMPLETVNQLRLRMLEIEAREEGRHFRLLGEPRPMRVLGIPAVANEFEHQLGTAKLRRKAVLLTYNGVEYWLAYDAPGESFDAHRATFEKMLLTFNPAPSEIGRTIRKPTADPQRLLEKYRASVVRVEALATENGKVVDGGYGTGWFIRRDGYLLTNHHVVWSEKLNRACDTYVLHWDVSLRREPVQAKLIDAVRSEFPWVDVALLKAKGSDYEPLPVVRVNPPGKYVKEQDRIMVMGYPGIVEEMRERMPLTLTSTVGNIIKFDLRPDHTVNAVMHDAVSSGGNSGGPAFDLEVHAVVGLHTMSLVEGGARSAYKGLVPVDAAYEYFPEIVCYPESVDAKFGAEDYLALAAQFHAQGLYKPALRQVARAFAKKMNVTILGSTVEAVDIIDKALENRPPFPEAFAVTGDILAAFGVAAAQKCYETALNMEPQNVRALMGLAALVPDRAIECYGEVLKARPRDHRALVARARSLLKAGRLEEAAADAQKACECCGDLYAEPYCVHGEILYAQKKFDDGRAKYERAVRIDPRDASARFGLVDYHHLQARYDDAVAQIEAMAADGARDMLWMRWSGDYCWDIADRIEKDDAEKAAEVFEKAYGYYGKAVGLYEDWSRMPDKLMVLRYAWYARERKKDATTALKWFSSLTRTLIRFDQNKRVNDPDLQLVYVNLGLVFRAYNREAHAGGFLQAALSMGANTPSGRDAKRLLKTPRTPLTLADIELVLTKTQIAHAAVADVVLSSPLAFQLSSKDAQVLLGQGWPKVVVDAMLKGGMTNTPPPKDRGRDEILAEWMEKDKRIVAESKKIAFDQRNELFEKYYKAHDKKDYRTSIPGFKTIFYAICKTDAPLASIAAYNVCCAYSLTGQIEAALDWFELCFYFGFFQDQRDMVAHCEKDTDLDNLRGEARFEAVMEAGRKIRKQSTTQRTNGGSMGVKLENLTSDERSDLGLNEGVGVRISSVTKGGPAEKAGVQEGDILCKLDGQVVGDARKAMDWIRARSPGTEISIVVLRDEEYLQGKVKLGSE